MSFAERLLAAKQISMDFLVELNFANVWPLEYILTKKIPQCVIFDVLWEARRFQGQVLEGHTLKRKNK